MEYFAQASTEQVPGWVYAQGGAVLVIALALLALIKQMLTTFETRTDKMLETFKVDQTAERGRSDASQTADRMRSDSHLEKVYAKLDHMTDRLYEARCRLPPGLVCEYQKLNRTPQNEAH